MTEPRQKTMSIIGRSGCYFLCVVRAAEKITGQRIDAVKAYLNAVKENWMDADCYMKRPELVLEMLSGIQYTIRHDVFDYRPEPDEIMVMRYEAVDTGITYSHFVLCDENGNIEYDPYGDSKTVRFGQPVSSRIFKVG